MHSFKIVNFRGLRTVHFDYEYKNRSYAYQKDLLSIRYGVDFWRLTEEDAGLRNHVSISYRVDF